MLTLDVTGHLQVSPETLIGESVAILGSKGSGKTNTAMVVVEEMLQHIGGTLIDIEGEMFTLREKYQLLVVGRSPHADIEITPDTAAQLAHFTFTNNLTVILDFSGYDEMEDMYAILEPYLDGLWKAAFHNPRPYLLVVEEAHEFIPQIGDTPVKRQLTRYALRGRKRGFSCLWISQRSANITKTVLTQCGVAFLHKVMHPPDKGVYADIVPATKKEVEAMISALETGHCIAMVNNTYTSVQMRRRTTYHVGATPGLKDTLPPMRAIDGNLLDQLQLQLGGSVPTSDDGDGLRQQIRLLEKRIAELQRENEQLRKGSHVTTQQFDKFLDDLRTRQTRAQKQVVAYLIRNPTFILSIREMAQATGNQEHELKKNPPLLAVRMGLIKQVDRRWKACAVETLQTMFPHIAGGVDKILEVLNG